MPAFMLLGTLYVGIGFYYFIETRDAGLTYLIFALLVVWATDSGAYFTGGKLVNVNYGQKSHQIKR